MHLGFNVIKADGKRGECCMGGGFCENANLNFFSGTAPSTKPRGMPWDRETV